MRKARTDEALIVRLGIFDYMDELTTTNPIGTKKGLHKYICRLAGCINLPQRLRFSTDFVMLLAIVASKVAKARGGMAWVNSGINAKGRRVSNQP